MLARQSGTTLRRSSIRAVGSSQASHNGGRSAGQGDSNARRRRRLNDILIVVEGINDMKAVKRAIDVDVRFDCQLKPLARLLAGDDAPSFVMFVGFCAG